MEQKIISEWITTVGYKAVVIQRKVDVLIFCYYFIEIPKEHALYGTSEFNNQSLDHYGDAFPIETDGWWIGYELQIGEDFKYHAEVLAQQLKRANHPTEVSQIYGTALKVTGIVVILVFIMIVAIIVLS